MMNTAKKLSFSHRSTLFQANTRRLTPLSYCLPKDSGMAAPMENRKKGKMRSTHVMP